MWNGFVQWFNYLSALIAAQQSAWAFLVSTALVAAAGAYFGGVAAQKIVSRENRRKRLLEVLNATNSVHSLSTTIFNQAATLKKQHYLPSVKQWEGQRAKILKGQANRAVEISVAVHFFTPPPIAFPIAALSDLIYSKLTLNGRPLGALSELVQAQHTLTVLSQAHNDLRLELEKLEMDEVVKRYFSLDYEFGRDDRYKDILFGSLDVLDDIIFFSNVICEDILSYGKLIREGATKSERSKLPQLNEQGKIIPGNEHLIPNNHHHKQWYDSHIMKDPKRKVSILKRLFPKFY